MKKLTYKQAKALVEAEIEKEGADFVYETHENHATPTTCAYFFDGKPDCIVGRVLDHFVNVTDEFNWMGDANDLLLNLQNKDRLKSTKRARLYLSSLQFYQDHGTPWGEAHKYSVKHIEPLEF